MNWTYYSVLGVPATASAEEIRSAYLRKSRALHPDVNPEGAEFLLAVQEAYRVLSDPAKRALYDRDLRGRPVAVPLPGRPATVDLTKLAQAFIPPDVYAHVGPSLVRALADRGIRAEAASFDQVLEAMGLLKKQKGKKGA